LKTIATGKLAFTDPSSIFLDGKVKGTVNAMGRFFNASTAKAGANGAVRELESIQDQCNQAS
jgi:hypothetical protein